jgi:GDP-L-fucose synthase
MDKNAKIYVAGHRGLVGSAIVRDLQKKGYHNLVLRISRDLDLRRQADVESFFDKERPEYVFHAAAKVGGILANNTFKAEFIYDNIMVATNVIHSAYRYGVKKLLNLGSSCIYPKFAPQPMKEEHLLTGFLEPTNEAYAIAKIAAIKLCRYYNEQYGTNNISVMPTNLYGPGDNFDLATSHVLPALIRKFHEAKVEKKDLVEMWGTGEPYREFMYVDDLADACVFLMERYNYRDIGEFVNIGIGEDIKIKDLAVLIKDIVGFNGEIRHDTSKPDGTPKKLLDVSKMKAFGWRHKINLEEGIKNSYQWYVQHVARN